MTASISREMDALVFKCKKLVQHLRKAIWSLKTGIAFNLIVPFPGIYSTETYLYKAVHWKYPGSASFYETLPTKQSFS